MSDNRRVYRTIRTTMRQLFPTEPKGNQARMLTTLAAMVSGIVLGKSCQLPSIARKAPDHAKAGGSGNERQPAAMCAPCIQPFDQARTPDNTGPGLGNIKFRG